MSKPSKARLEFFQQVKEFHEGSDIDPRFTRTAMEQYVVSMGGSKWDIEEQDFLEYSEWLRSTRKTFVIPK